MRAHSLTAGCVWFLYLDPILVYTVTSHPAVGYSWVSARPLSCRSFYHLLSASIYSQEKDKLLLVNTSGRTLQFHYVEGVKPRDATRHFTFLCIHKLRREDSHG